MPVSPQQFETQASFMRRCVPVYTDQGQSQAEAEKTCQALWAGSAEAEAKARQDEEAREAEKDKAFAPFDEALRNAGKRKPEDDPKKPKVPNY